MEEAAVISAVALVGLAVALVNLIASRLRLPPPLIYLAVGVIGGRSVTSFFHPDELGHIFPIFLEVLVGLLVFEGAFAINVRYLRRVGGVVRNLLTVGLVVTFVSATLLTGVLGVLPWRTAMMFGALVTVTGPTVIGPLVRETRLNDRVRSVLLGEGVLIDPLGAILAIIVLHFAITGFHIDDIWWAPSRLIGVIKQGMNAGVDMAGHSIGMPSSFTVGCALNMAADDLDREIRILRSKIRAGADFALGQAIFEPGRIRRFRQRYEQLCGSAFDLPVLMAVMPLRSHRQARFLHNEVPGIAIPDGIMRRIAAASDPLETGLQIAQDLIDQMSGLIQGAYIIPSGDYDLGAELVAYLKRGAG